MGKTRKKPNKRNSNTASVPASGQFVRQESNLESVPINPVILEKVRRVLESRGFPQYQKPYRAS